MTRKKAGIGTEVRYSEHGCKVGVESNSVVICFVLHSSLKKS